MECPACGKELDRTDYEDVGTTYRHNYLFDEPVTWLTLFTKCSNAAIYLCGFDKEVEPSK